MRLVRRRGALVAHTAYLSLGVLLIEVRAGGQRLGLLRRLLNHGDMRYVGQITARGTSINKVIDDCYVNLTHMRRFFPSSFALSGTIAVL